MNQVSVEIPFDDIVADDQARRIGETETSLLSLKESIKTLGLLDRLIVEDVGGGKLRLCAGRSRYKCIKSIREDDPSAFPTVPCTMLQFDQHELVDPNYKQYKISQVIFDSNDKRTELTQLEQARHYQAQMQQFPHLFPDYGAVARFNNKDLADVMEVMNLLAIAPEVMMRIEELNLQKPGTIPAMCIREIARASADAKRPLPALGQMAVIDMLISPDLKDKRALVLSGNMVALIKDTLRIYVPDNRGRRKAYNAGSAAEEVASAILDDQETSSNSPEVPADEHNGEAGDQREMSDTADNGATRDGSHGSANQKFRDGHSGETNNEGGAQFSGSGVGKPASAFDLSVSIIEANLTNIEQTIRKAHPALSREQYEEFAERLENVRVQLKSFISQPE